jgi:hypothetical protein
MRGSVMVKAGRTHYEIPPDGGPLCHVRGQVETTWERTRVTCQNCLLLMDRKPGQKIIHYQDPKLNPAEQPEAYCRFIFHPNVTTIEAEVTCGHCASKLRDMRSLHYSLAASQAKVRLVELHLGDYQLLFEEELAKLEKELSPS